MSRLRRRFRALAGMIKHYDRFIGGHDSAAINHLTTSNTRQEGRRGGRRRRRHPIFNDGVTPATSSLLPKPGEEKIRERYFGRDIRREGERGFLTVYAVRVACAGPVK